MPSPYSDPYPSLAYPSPAYPSMPPGMPPDIPPGMPSIGMPSIVIDSWPIEGPIISPSIICCRSNCRERGSNAGWGGAVSTGAWAGVGRGAADAGGALARRAVTRGRAASAPLSAACGLRAMTEGIPSALRATR